MGTKSVSVHEAKTHLSRLLQQVVSGETIVIERSGRPIARLVSVERSATPRVPGSDDVRIRDDFDQLPTNVRRAFGVGGPKGRRAR